MNNTCEDLAIVRLRDSSSLATRRAIAFILGEAKKGTKSIGFIPHDGLVQAVDEARVLVLERNGDRVAFCVHGRGRTSLKCFQIWVREDARELLHGRALVDELEAIARERYLQRIRLWCLEHLPATLFWQALGFTKRAQRPGGRWARSPHLLFVREVKLNAGLLF